MTPDGWHKAGEGSEGAGGEGKTVQGFFLFWFCFVFLHHSLSVQCTATAQHQWGEFLSAGEFSYANGGLVTVCSDAQTFRTLRLFFFFFSSFFYCCRCWSSSWFIFLRKQRSLSPLLNTVIQLYLPPPLSQGMYVIKQHIIPCKGGNMAFTLTRWDERVGKYINICMYCTYTPVSPQDKLDCKLHSEIYTNKIIYDSAK